MLKLLKKEKGNEGIKPGSSINDESESLKNTDISWCTKYSPNSIKDLAIHHSKTKAIREWLTPILEDPLGT